MWRGVTAVSTLRDDLTFIVSVSHFPNIISIILSFNKKIQEFMQIQELSRISKVL